MMKWIAICVVLLSLSCSSKKSVVADNKEVTSIDNEVLPGYTLIPSPNALDRPGRIIAISKDGTAQPLKTLNIQIDSGASVVGKLTGTRSSSFGALMSFFGGGINSSNPLSNKQVSYDLELEGCSTQRLQLLSINDQLQEAKSAIGSFSKHNNLSDYKFYLITECVKAKKLKYQFSNQIGHDFSLSLNLSKIASLNPNVKWNDEINYRLSYDLPEPLFVYCKYFKLSISDDDSISLGSQVVVKDPIYTDNAVMMGILYQQTAAEYKALCYQAYNNAKLVLNENLRIINDKPLAVVVGIDETVLSSGSYYAQQALTNTENFDVQLYEKWLNAAIADTIPGSASFLKYANSKGVTVFYLSNRDSHDADATIKNFKKYDLPNADMAHLLLRQNFSHKEGRRQEVAKSFKIVEFISSSLSDFNEGFENHPSLAKRDELAVKFQPLFGAQFIVLPNFQYGDWQSALYNYKYNLTRAQKDSLQKYTIKANQ